MNSRTLAETQILEHLSSKDLEAIMYHINTILREREIGDYADQRNWDDNQEVS